MADKTVEERQQDIFDEYVKEFSEAKLIEKFKEKGMAIGEWKGNPNTYQLCGELLRELKDKKNKSEAKNFTSSFRKEGGFKIPTHKEMLEVLHRNFKKKIELTSEWVNKDNQTQIPVFKARLVCDKGIFEAYGVVRLEKGEILELGDTKDFEKAIKEADTSARKRVIFIACPDYADKPEEEGEK